MDCGDLDNNSPDWLSCDDNLISNTDFCKDLQENFFDIQVLDGQDNQIQEFQGSQEGTTIKNLEPGTYKVNEIKHPRSDALDQLQEDVDSQSRCLLQNGFPDGGRLDTTTGNSYREICFEYEDEQGNDCTTNTIAAGEEKTCIVKNYIRFADKEIVP